MQPDDRTTIARICAGCERTVARPHAAILCPTCKWALRPGRTRTSFCSLFRYEGLLRDLLLRAKVQNQPEALSALVGLCNTHTATQRAIEGVQYVMPAPSSLWGRVWGKADIPWHVAKALCRTYGTSFLSPPFALRWRWHKQAHRKRTKGFFYFTHTPHSPFLPGLLLVDDVATSGETLRRVAERLENRYRIYFLVLADAGEWAYAHST
jgi:predicted amidophosphoribosyltransferase